MLKKALFLIAVFAALLLAINVNFVSANPGILVTIDDFNPSTINPGQTTTCSVTAESITTEAENLRLTINASSIFSFDWINKETVIEAGDKEKFVLNVKHNSDEVGNFSFTVSGVAWPADWSYEEAENLGFFETSSFTANITVVDSESPNVLYIILAVVAIVVIVIIFLFLRKK